MSNTLLLSRRHAGGISPYILTLVPQAVGGVSFTFTQRGTGSAKYSTDGENWTQFVSGQPTEIFAQNTSVYIKGNLQPVVSATWSDAGIGTFSASGNYKVEGCLASLIEPINLAGAIPDYAFAGLFANSAQLVDTSGMIFQSGVVGRYAYWYLFYQCANMLSTVSELPSLTVDEYGYCNMYSGCASLPSAPALAATSVANGGMWSMFENCTSFTAAPRLYPEKLNTRCYSRMFAGCTALTSAPIIDATSILGDRTMISMFSGCTSLEVAPTINIVSVVDEMYTFHRMFENCTSLRQIRVYFTSWTFLNNYEWVSGVAADGKFYCPAELPTYFGVSYIPTGWQVINI